MHYNQLILSGTCGGMVLSILPTISMGDLYRTIILAIIGATVSFFVSLVLKTLLKKKHKK